MDAETKRKSVLFKKLHADGILHANRKASYNTFAGKSHTEETKAKMSKSSKGKNLGVKNSQFGTMWITNGIESKKIKKDTPIPTDWRKGRKLSVYGV